MALEFKLEIPLESGLRPKEESGQIFDVAILGGGPAGMTAAVYAMRKRMKAVIITPDMGGQMLWTTGVENYMGFQYITGPDLAKNFSSQIRQFPVKLALGERVQTVSQSPDGLFHTATDGGREVVSRTLILATGKRSRELGVPGESEYRGRGVSYCAVCDGPFFHKQPVLVAGGGNSAVTAALDMLGQESPVTLVNAAEGWQADPVLLEKIKGQVEMLDQHRIIGIEGDGQVVTGVRVRPGSGKTERTIPAKGVFVEIGLLPNTEPFHGLVEFNDRGEVATDCVTRTSRPGVYAAGDCTRVPDKQIIIAAGEGAKAALAAYRFVKNIPD